ncbi:MAG TPA: SRPBCC domain-containing protein [Kofleriaceae bacterium]|nr:SRPBCC domain-containing protein [Kofleriaceae bacterium]
MTQSTAPAARPPVVMERTYEAPVEDLWELWTTREGFESWWGPEGFRVEVHELDLRVGGALAYDMIASDPEVIAVMQKQGIPLSHPTRGTFVEIEPLRRLKIRHMIDFVAGLEPYENHILLELFPEGSSVRMVVTIDPHSTDEWTQRAAAGFESQLRKIPALLAARRR